MDGVKLLNRTDTKYIFAATDFPDILESIRPYYRSLEVEGLRLNRYRTIYFDTPDFDFYRLHQNGKQNRYKVRIRKYMDSDLCFLENKFKSNKGRTNKKRIRLDDFEEVLSQASVDYLAEVMGGEVPMEAKLWNHFTRITLVSRTEPERLTIDLDLGFETVEMNGDKPLRAGSMNKLIVAEVKQEKMSRNSAFVQAIKSRQIRESGFSKYCMGAALLFPSLKRNNFKARMLKVNKLSNELVY